MSETKQRNSNFATIVGGLLTLVGFGGYIAARIVLGNMSKIEQVKQTAQEVVGAAKPLWLTLVELGKAYGIYIGIAGFVLGIIGGFMVPKK